MAEATVPTGTGERVEEGEGGGGEGVAVGRFAVSPSPVGFSYSNCAGPTFIDKSGDGDRISVKEVRSPDDIVG